MLTARRRSRLAAALITALIAGAGAPAAHAAPVDPTSPAFTAANLQRTGGRSHELTPTLVRKVVGSAITRNAERLAIHVKDPERAPDPNPCTTLICAVDPRLENWADHGGIVRPVLFTARDGATLSGHVWATVGGAAKRPGVLVINGSIVGYEHVYWWAAQALARAGYVVMTFDAQGEGDSDQFGEAPDRGESLIAGTPPIGDGGPFYDGGTDALDFFLSTPEHPYVPRKSRTSGTSHAAKQERRVKDGLNADYNPLWDLLDPAHLGVTGHSYGAMAASYLGQADPRLDAVVAWDDLCVPHNATQSEAASIVGTPGTVSLGPIKLPTAFSGFARDCFGAPPGSAPDVPITKPALGLNGDYIAPLPYLSKPDPGYRSTASRAYSAAGVDTASITIQGANHVDFSWVPLPAGTLRGIDLSTWYTVAWFDRYLKGDASADRRLLTARWRDDAATRAVDPAKDGNLYSQVYRSRIDMHTTTGTRVTCEDLRAGCAGADVPADVDCGAVPYGFVRVDTAPSSASDPGRAPCPLPAAKAKAKAKRTPAKAKRTPAKAKRTPAPSSRKPARRP